MKEGWEVKRLEDLLTLNQIGLVRNKKEQDPEFEFRYFKMDNIRNDNGIKEEGFSFINASAEEVSKYSLRNGDLLFNTRNSFELVGKSCLYTSDYQSPTIFNNNIMRMRFIPDLTSSYAAYAFSSELVLDQLEKIKSGTTSVVGIYFKTLKNIQIPVPPLAEQEAIVEILDKAFASIDQAKANLEQNITYAKELFQSKLNQIFSQKGEDWVEKTLISVTNFIDYRGRTPKKTESGIRLITAKNVRMGYLKRMPEEFIAENAFDDWMTRGIPNEGDVLFTTEAPLANVALLNTNEKIALAQRIITICPDRDILTGEYLSYCLQSKVSQDRILEKGTGATVTGIKSKLLKEIPISIAPKSRQNDIVEELDFLSDSTKQLESYYQTKLASLDELKKSILQKAFAGELT